MKGLNPRRRLALGVAIAALIAGGTLAIVSASDKGRAHRSPATVAKARAHRARLQAQTQTQAQAQTPTPTPTHAHGHGHANAHAPNRAGRAQAPRETQVSAAAVYLGVPTQRLRRELRAGRTL